MKNIIKNIVAALMLSGLIIVPVLSFAQTSGGILNDSNNLLSPELNSDKSQAEIEAIEEMLILEAKSNLQPIWLNDPQQINRRRFSSNLNVINDDKSQAEVEAKEELLYIQTISDLRMFNPNYLIQASSKQFSLISNLMAADYGEEMSILQSIR